MDSIKIITIKEKKKSVSGNVALWFLLHGCRAEGPYTLMCSCLLCSLFTISHITNFYSFKTDYDSSIAYYYLWLDRKSKYHLIHRSPQKELYTPR